MTTLKAKKVAWSLFPAQATKGPKKIYWLLSVSFLFHHKGKMISTSPPINNLSILSATQMHLGMSPLLWQSRMPFPPSIPTQSCFVQYSESENAHLFGLKEFCCFERLWAVWTIWICFELPSSKIMQCFSLFIETYSPTDNWRNSA